MKTIWQILKETLIGFNNEGSAKRATAAYVTVVILSALTTVYAIAFMNAANASDPTKVQIAVVDMYCPVLWSWLLFVCANFGLATIETLQNLLKTWRGQPVQESTNQNPPQ
jgi:hypothetical protein